MHCSRVVPVWFPESIYIKSMLLKLWDFRYKFNFTFYNKSSLSDCYSNTSENPSFRCKQICVCVCVRMSPPSCHHSLRSYLLPSVCHQSSLQVCAIMLWLLRCWETFTLKPTQAENILKVSALNLIHYKCMSNQKNCFFVFFGLICHAPLKIYL